MNKDFNTLEKVMCNMADSFYQPVEFPLYTQKLEKEFAELMAELNDNNGIQVLISKLKDEKFGGIMEIHIAQSHHTLLKDELADVLCFLLRISNSFKISGTELLHHAMSKMVKRIGDENYNRV